jgi:hypothetical protein
MLSMENFITGRGILSRKAERRRQEAEGILFSALCP